MASPNVFISQHCGLKQLFLSLSAVLEKPTGESPQNFPVILSLIHQSICIVNDMQNTHECHAKETHISM